MNNYDDEGSEWTPWFDDAKVYDIVKGWESAFFM